jgi:hypothetical protein
MMNHLIYLTERTFVFSGMNPRKNSGSNCYINLYKLPIRKKKLYKLPRAGLIPGTVMP